MRTDSTPADVAMGEGEATGAAATDGRAAAVGAVSLDVLGDCAAGIRAAVGADVGEAGSAVGLGAADAAVGVDGAIGGLGARVVVV